MAVVQTLCSNSFSLSSFAPQNIWTTRVLPLTGNAVITGFVLRDTVGVAGISDQNITVFLQIGAVTAGTLLYLTQPGVPGFAYSNNIVYGMLTANPTVTAQLGTTIPPGITGTVTIDVLGYYI